MPKFSEIATRAIRKYDDYRNKFEVSEEIAKLFCKNYSAQECMIDSQRAPLLCLKYKTVKENISERYYLKDIQDLLGVPDWQLRKYIKKGMLSASSNYSENGRDNEKVKNPGKSKYRVSKSDLLNFIVNNQSVIQCSSFFNEKEFEHEGRRIELIDEIKKYTKNAKSLYNTEKFLVKKDNKTQIEEENLYAQIEAIELVLNDISVLSNN